MRLVGENGAAGQASRQKTTERSQQLTVFRQHNPLPLRPPRPFRALPCSLPNASEDYVTPCHLSDPPRAAGSSLRAPPRSHNRLHNKPDHRSHHRSHHRSYDRSATWSASLTGVSLVDSLNRTSRCARTSCCCSSGCVCLSHDHTLKGPLYRRPPFRRTPVTKGIPQAAYTSLTLLICLLLLLPPCADSLSRIRDQENATLTKNANNLNPAAAAVSVPLVTSQQSHSGSSATSSSTATTTSYSSRQPTSCSLAGVFYGRSLRSLVGGDPSGGPSTNPDNCNQTRNKPAQCLVLTPDMAREVCGEQVPDRVPKMRKLRLRFCDKYWLHHVIGPRCQLEGSERQCNQCLEEISALDTKIRDMYHQFVRVLHVVEDCAGNFSTHWSCDDCKGAYRAWLCSTSVPYHKFDLVVPPCSHFCETVENRCPYFVPHADTQYAGEPSFLCRDVSIRFKLGHTEEVTPKRSESCYGPCRMSKESSQTNVNNSTMSSSESDNDNQLCYFKGRTSRKKETSATKMAPSAPTLSTPSQSDSSSLPTATSSSSATSLRTHILVLAQLLFWSMKTLTLHRDIGLT